MSSDLARGLLNLALAALVPAVVLLVNRALARHFPDREALARHAELEAKLDRTRERIAAEMGKPVDTFKSWKVSRPAPPRPRPEGGR